MRLRDIWAGAPLFEPKALRRQDPKTACSAGSQLPIPATNAIPFASVVTLCDDSMNSLLTFGGSHGRVGELEDSLFIGAALPDTVSSHTVHGRALLRARTWYPASGAASALGGGDTTHLPITGVAEGTRIPGGRSNLVAIIVEQNLLLCVSFSAWGRCFGFYSSQIPLTVGISMRRSR